MNSSGKINCYVGIDLGSTTTKAIIINEANAIIGRGITNSRSNYDIACQVARTEAFINARFSILGSLLQAQPLSIPVDELLQRIHTNFRRQQHLSQFEDFCNEMLGEASGERYEKIKRELPPMLEDIFAKMQVKIDETFKPGSAKRSDFFRDITGSHFAQCAEQVADKKTVGFDVLMSIYDKCIIRVENHALDLSFKACIDGAFQHSVTQLKSRSEFSPAKDGKLLERAIEATIGTDLKERNTVGTGYGRARLPFPKQQIRSEILCHGLGAHRMFSKTRTVLDIGGQDTKAIQVDPNGIVTSFQMNDRCAAGCGRYLGYIADEMNLGLHELGPLAQKSCAPVKINSTCTVFAGAELRERLSVGQRREDILAGLHRAIILRAMSLLARSGGIQDEFTFTGGVANNTAAVAALRKLVEENYGSKITMNISPDSIYTGALGAAMFAGRDREGVTLDSPETEETRTVA